MKCSKILSALALSLLMAGAANATAAATRSAASAPAAVEIAVLARRATGRAAAGLRRFLPTGLGAKGSQ